MIEDLSDEQTVCDVLSDVTYLSAGLRYDLSEQCRRMEWLAARVKGTRRHHRRILSEAKYLQGLTMLVEAQAELFQDFIDQSGICPELVSPIAAPTVEARSVAGRSSPNWVNFDPFDPPS